MCFLVRLASSLTTTSSLLQDSAVLLLKAPPARVGIRSRNRPKEALATLRLLLAFAGNVKVFIDPGERAQYDAVFGQEGVVGVNNRSFNEKCVHCNDVESL